MSTATAPVVICTRADVTVRWSLDIRVEPGSVPDRIMPHSGTGGSYRPVRVRLEFGTQAASLTLAQLNFRHARMTGLAQRDAHLMSVALYGQRLLANGQPGGRIHTEKLHGRSGRIPEWVRSLAAAALTDLTAREVTT